MQNEELIIKYLPLARKLGKKLNYSHHIDGVAEAQFALVIAAYKFRPELGGSFPLFAAYAIRDRLRSLRAKQYPQTVDWQSIGEGVQQVALAVAPDQESRVIRREFVRHVLDSLTRPEKRMLLLLLRRESQQQIGKRLGISQPTVSRRISALRNRAVKVVEIYNGSS